MIAISALKHAAGETVVQLFGQNLQQLIDRQHGIIHGIAGVCCRDLFISDKQERLRRIQLQAIVKHRRQSLAAQLRQGRSADFRSVQQAFVGRAADGIVRTIYPHGKTEVFRRVLNGLGADSRSECGRSSIKRRRLIQRLNMQFIDPASVPSAFQRFLLMVPAHPLVGSKGRGVVVLAWL